MTPARLERGYDLAVAANRTRCQGVSVPDDWKGALALSNTAYFESQPPVAQLQTCTAVEPLSDDELRGVFTNQFAESNAASNLALIFEYFRIEETRNSLAEAIDVLVDNARNNCDS